jgi:hypothetical protein
LARGLTSFQGTTGQTQVLARRKLIAFSGRSNAGNVDESTSYPAEGGETQGG